MTQKTQIVVVGGGVVGLSAALAMAQQGYSVVLMDAGSLEVDISITDKRVYAINKASQSLFKKLGVWQCLDEKRLSPYNHMHVWDALSGAHIDFDSRSIADYRLGFIIEESILKQALLQRIHDEPIISVVSSCCIDKVVELEQGIGVSSKNNQWEGRLLMIADGANSPTRQQLQVPLTTWSYDQQALVATVRTEKSHDKTAYQVFNPSGPLAFLPLSDSHHCSIVWSTQPEKVHHLMALNSEAFNKELTTAFARRLGQVELISERHHFPLIMRHAKQYVGAHWLLLGDAAHTIHPLAGLGLNLGLADLTAWLRHLEERKSAFASPKMLGSYQRERKHAVWQTIMVMEGLKQVFANTLKPVVGLRGLGLRLCNELPLMKRFCIEHAQG